jgi:peptidoglycan-N-acetylglucosamine deacetylase
MLLYSNKKIFLCGFLFFFSVFGVLFWHRSLSEIWVEQRKKEVLFKNPPVTQQSIAIMRNIDCKKVKCIALTFDDGPSKFTKRLLEILKKENIRVTFFVLGSQIDKHKNELRSMIQEWHQIGNHTWNHLNLTKIDASQRKQELEVSANKIEEISWVKTRIFRPPYWALNTEIEAETRYPIILWNKDTRDWERPKTETIIANALENSSSGSIILLHDIYERSIDAVPIIIEKLKKRAYTFVTIEELFWTGWLEKGKVYTSKRD